MRIIVISPERDTSNEVTIVNELFEKGLKYFHLRKPQASYQDLKKYLEQINPIYHKEIIVHSHHHLLRDFELKGIHFPERLRVNLTTLPLGTYATSSFHGLEELKKNTIPFKYVFLSPIFESLSKKGYIGNFTKDNLKNALSDFPIKVMALGGIEADKLPFLKSVGFAGAAFLGAIWNSHAPIEQFLKIKKKSEESGD